MMFRTAVAVLLASTSMAAADEIVLAPSCAEIDDTTVPPEARTAMLALLTRALEEANLVVVANGCTDHYVLSHEDGAEASEQTLRLAGPHATIRLRHVPHAPDLGAFTQLVAAVIAEPEPAPAAAPEPETGPASEPEGSTPSEPSTEVDASTTESPPPAHTHGFFTQLLAGSQGTGVMLGFRHQFDANVLDVALGAVGDGDYSVGLGHVRVLHLAAPTEARSTYGGAGLAFAHESDYMTDASGPRIEGVVGLDVARDEKVHLFFEAEIGIPTYKFADQFTPSFAVSAGLGF